MDGFRLQPSSKREINHRDLGCDSLAARFCFQFVANQLVAFQTLAVLERSGLPPASANLSGAFLQKVRSPRS
jgi:hypothetical protein